MKKKSFSILVSWLGTKNGETTLHHEGGNDNSKTQLFGQRIVAVPPVAKPKTTPNRESKEKIYKRGKRNVEE